MTSLRDRFIAAEKQQKENRRLNELEGLSGELAVFAATLPGTLEELVIRVEAGQPGYTFAYTPALHHVFKTGYYAPYSTDYRNRREFPGCDEMLDLQGFRKLLDTCSDPAVDVCLRMSFSRPDAYRSGLALTIDIQMNEPFSASTFVTQGPERQAERHAIGADYIAANRKPFKPPAVLKLNGAG